MPDTYTSSSISFVQTAYDRLARFALRPELYFDQCADVKPTFQSMPGNAVIFNIVSDLAPAESTINESSDVAAVSVSNSQITVTLNEYGNATLTTALLRGTAFVDIDPVVANVVGYNAGISIDGVVRSVLQGGSNVYYPAAGAATSRATLTNSSVVVATDLLKGAKKLRAKNVQPFNGLYACYLHPNVSFDIQNDATSVSSWRAAHQLGALQEVWQGEVGTFGQVRVIETPRAPVLGGVSGSQFSGGSYSGSGTTVVYASFLMGRESLAKAYSMQDGNGPDPRIIVGPVVDKLRRNRPLGWYHLVGYGLFRTDALWRLESGSSLADVDAAIDED